MKLFRFPLYLQTLIGMLLGILVGLWFGKDCESLGVVSKTIIEVIKNLAIPLLFFAILDAFIHSELKGRGLAAMGVIYSINALLAISIALFISNFFQPGKFLPLQLEPAKLDLFLAHHNISFREFLTLMQDPTKFSKSLKGGSLFSGTTAAISLALLTGMTLVLTKTTAKMHRLNAFVLKWLFKLITLLTYFIPIAVFCAVAKVVGVTGFTFVKGLLSYFVFCAAGMAAHIFIVYQGWILFSGMSLKKFWRESKEAISHSFGINSSLATLPITLKTLKNMKVSDGSVRMAACVGTNFNNDGILLYEVVAALFMIQAYGQSLSILDQLELAFICVIATIGVAGIPEAGMISLAIVLTAIKLPLHDLPILLTVDWVLGRMRSVTNVIGDLSGAISIDKLLSISEKSLKQKS